MNNCSQQFNSSVTTKVSSMCYNRSRRMDNPKIILPSLKRIFIVGFEKNASAVIIIHMKQYDVKP